MAAHSTPSTRRQLRVTALTSIVTALAAVGLMFVGSALTTSPPGREAGPAGTTATPVMLVDAPAATSSTTPAVGKSSKPTTSSKATTSARATTTTKPPRTTTTRPTDD
jgi:hypothetical protein